MKWLLGIVVSAILLVWSFYDVDLEPLIKTFSNISLWAVLLMVICIGLFFVFKIKRWTYLLRPIGQFSSTTLVPSTIIGTAVNYVFFGYIGEFVRTWILSKETSTNKSPILMSIVMERIFDLWTLLLFLGIASYLSPTLSPYVASLGYFAAGLGLLATLFAGFLVFFSIPQWFFGLFPGSWQERIKAEVVKCTTGLRSIAHPQLILFIVAASLLQWSFMCASNWMATIAVGITIPPWALFGPMGLMILGMTLPSTPGQLGVIEISYVLGLLPWGVSKEQALAAGLLFHLILYLSVITTAFIISRKLNISWTRQ